MMRLWMLSAGSRKSAAAATAAVLILLSLSPVYGQEIPDSERQVRQDTAIHQEQDDPGTKRQIQPDADTANMQNISTGWADKAITIGYYSAPSVLGLMFVSALVSEWNAGFAGIPASLVILAAPPVIYGGGRSVGLPRSVAQPRARLGWTLYAISIIPTSLALYGFTTDWGASLPLTIASGVLGSASIIAMTTYTNLRADRAMGINNSGETSWSIGISPLPGGAIATIAYRFR